MGEDSGSGGVIVANMAIVRDVLRIFKIADDEIITTKECSRYSYIGSVI